MKKITILLVTLLSAAISLGQAPKKWTDINGNYNYIDSARFARLKYYGTPGDSVLSTNSKGDVILVKSVGGSGGAQTWQQTLTTGSILTADNTVTSPTGKTFKLNTTGTGSLFSEWSIKPDTIKFSNSTNGGGRSYVNISNATASLHGESEAGDAVGNVLAGAGGATISASGSSGANALTVANSASYGWQYFGSVGGYFGPRETPTEKQTFIGHNDGTITWGVPENFVSANLEAFEDRAHNFNHYAVHLDSLAEFKISNNNGSVFTAYDGGTMSFSFGPPQYFDLTIPGSLVSFSTEPILAVIDIDGVIDTFYLPYLETSGADVSYEKDSTISGTVVTCLGFYTAGSPSKIILQVARTDFDIDNDLAYFDGDTLKKAKFVSNETLATVTGRGNTTTTDIFQNFTVGTAAGLEQRYTTGGGLVHLSRLTPNRSPSDHFPNMRLAYATNNTSLFNDFNVTNYGRDSVVMAVSDNNDTRLGLLWRMDATTNYLPEIPHYNGYMATQVNGVPANINGGITIPVGTVNSLSVVSANGFAGSFTAGATPALTISTSISGLLKGDGSAMSAAVAGTDYLTPTGSAAGLTSFPTLNQNTTGSAASWTTGRTLSITGDVSYTSPSINGTGNVTAAATVTRINGVSLAGLATGIYKNTTGTGVPSIAVAADFPTLNQNTTGSAATITTARLINGVSFNGSANIAVTNKILAYAALGSTIIAQNVDGDLSHGGAGALPVSQRLYLSAVWLDKAQTVTGVKWIQITAGDYTASNYNGVGLYTYASGTLTLVASSTNDGNIWKATTGTMSSKAFSSTYSATAGLYFVGLIYSSSAVVTAPSFGIINAASGINTIADFTNSAKTSGLVSSLTALPATQAMSGVTAASTEYKTFLY